LVFADILSFIPIHIDCKPSVAYYCDTRHVFATLHVYVVTLFIGLIKMTINLSQKWRIIIIIIIGSVCILASQPQMGEKSKKLHLRSETANREANNDLQPWQTTKSSDDACDVNNFGIKQNKLARER